MKTMANGVERTSQGRGRPHRRTPSSSGPQGVDSRSEILAALGRLLNERSFESISAIEIIDEAGVSRPTFYKYFTSKYDAVTASADAVIREIYHEIWLPFFLSPEAPSEAAMVQHWLVTLEAWRTNQAVLVAAAQTARMDQRNWQAVWGRYVAATREYIVRARLEWGAPEELDATTLAMFIVGMIDNAFYLRFGVEDALADDNKFADTLARLYLRNIFGSVSHQ